MPSVKQQQCPRCGGVLLQMPNLDAYRCIGPCQMTISSLSLRFLTWKEKDAVDWHEKVGIE